MELIISPGIIFLDEPTTGLDATTAVSVVKLLKKYVVQNGVEYMYFNIQGKKCLYDNSSLYVCMYGHVCIGVWILYSGNVWRIDSF